MSGFLILAMPLILAAFALGFDSLRYMYIENYIQTRLDGAVQTGVSQTVSYSERSGTERIAIAGDPHAPSTPAGNIVSGVNSARKFYADNTARWREPVGEGHTQGILLCSPAPPSSGSIQPASGYNPATKECGGIVEIVGGTPASGVSSDNAYPLQSNELCSPLSNVNSTRYGLRYTVTEKVNPTFLKMVGVEELWLHGLSSTAYVRGRGC